MPKRSPPPAPGIRPGAASFGRAIDLFPRCFNVPMSCSWSSLSPSSFDFRLSGPADHSKLVDRSNAQRHRLWRSGVKHA